MKKGFIMEEEVKKESVEEKSVEEKGAEKKSITLSADIYSFLIAIATLALYLIYNVIVAFGVRSNVLNGIFTIILYSAAIFGFGFAFLRDRKMSIDVIISLVVMCVIFMTI